jgi:hypothetical protein
MGMSKTQSVLQELKVSNPEAYDCLLPAWNNSFGDSNNYSSIIDGIEKGRLLSTDETAENIEFVISSIFLKLKSS